MMLINNTHPAAVAGTYSTWQAPISYMPLRDMQEDLGWMLETNLNLDRRLDERKSGQKLSHSLDWFRWVCDNWEILPGFKRPYERVKGAVYEADLVNYAALQGSGEILRWLIEEKGCKLNNKTGDCAGLGGSVEVLGYLVDRGYNFSSETCRGAAMGGCLEASRACLEQV